MAVTGNMGLTIWDLPADQFDHSLLANNLQAIDQHTHEVGKGPQIPSGGLVNSAVVTAKLADLGVTTAKLADIGVTQAKLAKPSVGTLELLDGAVTNVKIGTGAISADKLDPAMIPIGQCILWLRADVTVPLPGGFWEPLDGRAWSTVTNKMGAGGVQLNTGTMPDTRNAFPLGAATTGTGAGTGTPPAIGQAGGSHTYALNHAHGVTAHAHTIGAHAHTQTDHVHGIVGDGNHNHGMFSRQTKTLALGGSTGDSSFLQTLYVAGFNSGGDNASVPGSGAHSHGGSTVGAGAMNTGTQGSYATSSDGSSTDSQLSATQDIRPKYVGFLILCRVR